MTDQSFRGTYRFGPFVLDAANRQLRREGTSIVLQPKTFDLLLILVERRGRLVTKDELLKALWPDVIVEEANLTQNVYLLRKALEQTDAKGPYIETVQKHGYRFTTDVRPQSEIDGGARTVVHARRAAIVLVSVGLLAGAAGLVMWMRFVDSAVRSAPHALRFTRLTTTGSTRNAVISRDGRYVAYAEATAENMELWLQQISTRAATRLVVAPGRELRAPIFSSDAAHLFYVEAHANDASGALRRVASLGGEPTTLATGVFGFLQTTPLAVSPDDRWVAFVRYDQGRNRSRLMIASAVDGNGEREVASVHDPERFGSLGWQPSGTALAYSLSRSRGMDGVSLNLVEPFQPDRRSTIASAGDWTLTRGLAWLPSGRELLVIARSAAANSVDQIFRVGYPDGQVSRVTNDLNGYDGLSLTADGQSLLTVQLENVSRIWVGESRNDAVTGRDITSGGAAREGLRGFCWTREDRIVFEAEPGEEPNLWIMDVDGRNRRQLTSGALRNITPVASRDGRYIVFSSNRSGSFTLWRIDIDGSHPTQLTTAFSGRFAITPDSRWVVFPSGDTIWRVSIDGGPPVSLIRLTGAGPAISPDGQTLAVLTVPAQTPSRIVLVPLVGEPAPTREMPLPYTVYGAPSTLPLSLTWMPDGRAVAYPDSPGGVSNLWIAPLDGSPRRQITSFTEDRLSQCSWNFSGALLACVRYAHRTDVVQIFMNGRQ